MRTPQRLKLGGARAAAIVLCAANLSGVVLTRLWMAADARSAGLTTIDAVSHREQRYRALYIEAARFAGGSMGR